MNIDKGSQIGARDVLLNVMLRSGVGGGVANKGCVDEGEDGADNVVDDDEDDVVVDDDDDDDEEE